MPASTVTLGTLLSRCLSYGYGNVDENQFKIWLNQAYFEVAGTFKWDWTQSIGTVNTVVGLGTSPIPSNLAFFGRLGTTDGQRPPEFMDAMDFREYLPTKDYYGNYQGRPKYFSIFAGNMNWTPIPDAIYSYNLYYWRAPSELVNTSDVSLIPDADVDVLVLGALRNAAMRENDLSKVNVYTTQFQSALSQMMRNQKARQQQKVSRVPMPESYGGTYDNDVTSSNWWRR